MTLDRPSGSRKRLVILVPSAADELAPWAAEHGYEPVLCANVAAVLRSLRRDRPTAVIMDWLAPDGATIDLCRQARLQCPYLPIVFVSSRDDELSVTRAFDAGADDYLGLPLRPAELAARVESHVRKAGLLQTAQPRADGAGERYTFGDIEVDTSARAVSVDRQPVQLGALEFELLQYLCRNTGVALSRDRILEEVYGYDASVGSQRVDLLVQHLRKKLGSGARRGGQIATVRGYGYRLERRSGRRPATDDA